MLIMLALRFCVVLRLLQPNDQAHPRRPTLPFA